jgi:SAM-dependent methyltransferase
MKDEQIVECDLCGNPAELVQENFTGYQKPNTFTIYHCSTCDTSFSLPRSVTSALYENIYKNGKNVPGYSRYWIYLENVKTAANPLEYLAETEDTYWGVRKALSLFVKDKKSTRILEVGSGLGYLTYSLIRENYEVVGLDISPTAVEQANKTFGEYYKCADLFEFSKLHAESFDIVILTEVIEHIDKPIHFIESIKSLLKPGGRAIITTPNKSFYPPEISWVGDPPPVHFWWFSENSMKFIADKMSIKVEFINFESFYKKKYFAIDLKRFRLELLPEPVLSENGELLPFIEKPRDKKRSYLSLIINKMPYLKKLSHKLRSFLGKKYIFCGERGQVICAVFKK